MSLGSSIVGLFGRSPIKPLQHHYETVHACVARLSDFFAAIAAEDWALVNEIQQDITRLENEADELKKEYRLNLPNSLFLPMPRTDLLDMISVQDRVANKAKDIAGLMRGRQMKIPASVSPAMAAYVSRAIDASAQAMRAINELDELLETGFGGREVKLIERLIEELDSVEGDTDDQQVLIRAQLFKLESEWPPVDMMFLYKIVDWVGDLADRAQKVGGFLHMLVAR
ncbi:MAG: TIGR00153 family protein [Gammaproteobacteria bacterium]|nr:TIGR00153 family protein [Gammaproteobacteria bacterium]MBQ0774990.1 TIGR00153 family protein [Gammaproteobacteria bacterium]|tara:strand:+ start:33543 stop:34223 length:681 start_codon:yes stop_codon:yes gene_type:complete